MPPLLEGAAAHGHLLRRAGFGASPRDVEATATLPYEDLVERLLAGLDAPPPDDPADFDPYEPGAIQRAWLGRMLSGEAPLAERLALFWHGHFATSDAKVQDPLLLWRQVALLRARGAGRFVDLVQAVCRDVAMVLWLDGNANRKGHPNENFARELQELFVLGIGNYTESDVREVARAFTGWGSRGRTFRIEARFHDDGTKTVHGRHGALDGDDVVRILTGLDACHRHLATRLLAHFSHPDPTPEQVDALAAVLRRSGGEVKAALRTLFLDPGFRDPRRRRALVRSPVEYLVASLRAVGAAALPRWGPAACDGMGQILFRPPSVKGWTGGAAWLGAGALVARLDTAARVAAVAPPGAEEVVVATAFDGVLPPALARAADGQAGRTRLALLLAAPEAQLA